MLEKNGVSSSASNTTYGIPIRDHQTVINSFTNDIMALVNGDKLTSPGDDYVKNVETYMNIARAIDLYLALENAYTKWSGVSGNTSWLLSQTEKQKLMERFIADLQDLYDNYVHKPYSFGVNEDDVEPGNRPLKGHIAIGYGVMAIQDATGWDGIDHRLGHTIWRASEPTTDNRHKHWMYQTGNGSRYWAEGAYYFNYALVDVVPFWHAIRANGMLGSVSDPFNNSWFLKPVEWLADVSTPDGLTPPLDDGNKHRISAAPMLRWSSTYGNESIGKKFNYIYRITTLSFNNNSWLIELALPKTTQETVINYNVTSSSEPHKIIRHKDSQGKMHYLLINGETGNMIIRGEGHEQPDQLQLLYYVDGNSYLMDTGYDRAGENKYSEWGGLVGRMLDFFDEGSELLNSEWNKFKYHNVLHPEAENGLDPPRVKVGKTRLISNHNSVDYLNHKNYGKIDLLTGSVQIQTSSTNLSTGETIPVQYLRKTLLIHSELGISPYIIDLNSHVLGAEITDSNSDGVFGISSYFSDTRQHYRETGNNWNHFTFSNDKDLYLYLEPIGSSFWNFDFTSDTNFELRERYNGGTNYLATSIKSKIQIHNTKEKSFISFIHTRNDKPELSQLFNVSDPPKHQGYLVKQSSTVVDVVVKRIKYEGNGGSNSHYSQNLEFDIDANGIKIPFLSLPAGKDYGFARFRKSNGVWLLDANYQINLTQEAHVFASSTTVSSQNLTKGDIYIGDGVRLTVDGGILSGNKHFKLGGNAELLFASNTSLELNSSSFSAIDSAIKYHWVKVKGPGVLTGCNISGGTYNLIVDAGSHEVDLIECAIYSGNYGLWVASGYAWLQGTDILSNSSHGLYVSGDALATVNRKTLSNGFIPSRIYGNGGKGMHLTGTSQTFLGYSRVEDNTATDEIWVDYSAQLTAGGSMGLDAQPGYNRLLAGGDRYIYNRNSWQIPADHNYWGGTEPASTSLYGPVDYEPWYNGDPSISGNDPGPLQYSDGGDGGGGSGPGGTLSVNTETGTPNLSGSTMTNNTKREESLTAIAGRLNAIYEYADAYPYNADVGVYIREGSRLAALLDRFGTGGEKREYLQRLNEWRQRYSGVQTDNARRNLSATLLARLYSEMDDSDLVEQLAAEYSPFITDKLSWSELLTIQAIAWQKDGHYQKAHDAYSAIEELFASAEDPVDYSMIRQALRDSVSVYGPGNLASAGFPLLEKQFVALPEEFTLEAPYPNPFNPNTTIRFGLPEAVMVRAEVYDLLGRRVMGLADRRFQAGFHRLSLNAGSLSSGTYFVRILAGGRLYIQQVTLIK